MLGSSEESQVYLDTNLDQSQPYLPNLLVMSALSFVNRFLTAMVDIPTQSSNPSMYSLLKSYLMLLIYL